MGRRKTSDSQSIVNRGWGHLGMANCGQAGVWDMFRAGKAGECGRGQIVKGFECQFVLYPIQEGPAELFKQVSKSMTFVISEGHGAAVWTTDWRGQEAGRLAGACCGVPV